MLVAEDVGLNVHTFAFYKGKRVFVISFHYVAQPGGDEGVHARLVGFFLVVAA